MVAKLVHGFDAWYVWNRCIIHEKMLFFVFSHNRDCRALATFRQALSLGFGFHRAMVSYRRASSLGFWFS